MRIQEPVRPDEPLCHYIPLEFFCELLRSKSFYAKRIDQYHDSDPNEGILTEAEDQELRAERRLIRKAQGASDEVIAMEEREANRLGVNPTIQCSYVLCLRRDMDESEKAWSSYLRGSPGVMLRTSATRIANALDVWVRYAPVVYRDRCKEKNILGLQRGGITFCKDCAEWSWENELSILYYLLPLIRPDGSVVNLRSAIERLNREHGIVDGSAMLMEYIHGNGLSVNTALNPDHFNIPFETADLFEKIVLSPKMIEEDAIRVRKWVSSARLSAYIVRSTLDSGR